MIVTVLVKQTIAPALICYLPHSYHTSHPYRSEKYKNISQIFLNSNTIPLHRQLVASIHILQTNKQLYGK